MYRTNRIVGAVVVSVLVLISYNLTRGQSAQPPAQPATAPAATTPAPEAAVIPQGAGTPATAPPTQTAPTTIDIPVPVNSTTAPATPTPTPSLSNTFPYTGKIVGDNVHVRSGPGEIWYPVGKADKNQPIIVVEEKFGWCKIEPTKQCFSLINKEYVKLQETPPAVTATPATPDQPFRKYGKNIAGEVTGNNVRVRAGSDRVGPDKASEVQTTLSQGAKIEAIGEWGNFYMIVPPKGSYFWIAKSFTKRTGDADASTQDSLRAQAAQAALDKPAVTPAAEPAKSESAKAAPAKPKDNGWWDQYMAVRKDFETERAKPIIDQDYAPLRNRLDTLITKADSDWMRSNAENLNRLMMTSQIAADSAKQSKQSDAQLQAKLAQIDKELKVIANEMTPKNVRDDVTIKGTLRYSAVFGKDNPNRRFIVMDDEEKILCYVIADVEGLKLVNWVDKKIAVKGRLEPDMFSVNRLWIVNVKQINEIPANEPAPGNQITELVK